MPFPNDHKYTAEEFFSLSAADDSEHCELINGEIVAQAAPSTIHQLLITELLFSIKNFINANNGRCIPLISPYDVKLDDNNVVQPDVMVICDKEKIDDKRCNGAPDLVIEVTSSNYGRDYVDKLELYRRSGVREYWIVDPLYKRIMVYFFEKSDFPSIYTFDTAVPVGIYGGKLTINIRQLLS